MKKIIIGIVIAVVAGLFIAITGWNFTATADVPAIKQMQEQYQKQNDTDHKEIKDALRDHYDQHRKTQQQTQDKLDKIYDKILELHSK